MSTPVVISHKAFFTVRVANHPTVPHRAGSDPSRARDLVADISDLGPLGPGPSMPQTLRVVGRERTLDFHLVDLITQSDDVMREDLAGWVYAPAGTAVPPTVGHLVIWND